jgi:hypothetical protein
MLQALRSLIPQLAFAVLTLLFGVLSLRVAPVHGRGPREDAWYLTGITFTTIGALATVSGVLAFPVVAAGEGSESWDVFLRTVPITNDARSFAVFGFALALGYVVVLRRAAPGRGRTAAGLALMLAIGAGVGVLEGPFQANRQMPMMALLGAVTSLALFYVLYVALVRDAMDWLLWTALALYAAREAATVNLQSLLAWWRRGPGGPWVPSPSLLLWMGLVSVLPMIVCTLHRLSLARAGRDAPGLLERLRR